MLAKRLIYGNSASEEAEANMISRLKVSYKNIIYFILNKWFVNLIDTKYIISKYKNNN